MSDAATPPAHLGQRKNADTTPPTCSCGHDRTHFMVSAECKYTAWGWFWVTVIGASARPTKAIFRCRTCGEIVEETTDDAVLRTLV